MVVLEATALLNVKINFVLDIVQFKDVAVTWPFEIGKIAGHLMNDCGLGFPVTRNVKSIRGLWGPWFQRCSIMEVSGKALHVLGGCLF